MKIQLFRIHDGVASFVRHDGREFGRRYRPRFNPEVLEISAPSASGSRAARPTRRSRFTVLGDEKLAGLVGLVGLLLALVGVVIAFLSWRGDERDRSTKTGLPASTPAAGTSPPFASAPATPSVSPTTGAPTVAAGPPTAAPHTTEHTPKPTTGETAKTGTTSLSYRLDAARLNSRTVKVVSTPTGRPVSGESYWFMIEINWGDGNTDYYPRRRVIDRAESFDISIPPDARADVVRTGRVYALNEGQSADAEVRFARQTSTTNEDDFFAEQTGRAVSNGERLPF